MKQTLLSTLLLLLSAAGFSQVAPQIPSLTECDINDGVMDGQAIFNMYYDAQVHILAAQPLPSENYEVTFHHSAPQAATGTNSINNFDYYFSTGNGEDIYYRVKQLSNNSWAIGSFKLFLIHSLEMQDVFACDSYVLPPLTWGNYYTAPGGAGTMLAPGYALFSSMEVYVYQEGCSINESFHVTIQDTGDVLNVPQAIIACGSYTLPVSELGEYRTADNGGGSFIAPGTVLTQNATFFIYLGGACNISIPQNIFIGPGGPTSAVVTSCDDDSDGITQNDLTASITAWTALAAGTTMSYYETEADAQAGSNPIADPEAYVNTVPFEQEMFVRVESAGCFFVDSFTVMVSWLDLQESYSVTACDPDNNGVGSISVPDFEVLLNTIKAGNTSLLNVDYFTSQAAAEANVNPLELSNGYLTPQTTLYVRTNHGYECYRVVPVTVTVSNSCSDNRIVGHVLFDTDNNGCDGDPMIPGGVQAVYTGSGQTIYSPVIEGSFLFTDLPDGAGSIAIESNVPGISSVSPASATVTFPMTGDVTEMLFCAAATATAPDLAVSFIPLTEARPGFMASYMAMITTNATAAGEAVLSIQFDSSKVSYIASGQGIQTGNTVTITIPDVLPFYTYSIPVNFLVAQPPVVQGDMLLMYAASVTGAGAEATPDDNTHILSQLVVNSYDPNDIAVHQGAAITPAQAAEDLHYTIRFQNTGSASAVNVRIETTLDNNLDAGTFRFLSSSHVPVVQRNGNKVVFLFEKIYLPAEQQNEPGSHGYVTYRVKPVAGIQLGQSMQATANIYFDYNPAVVTNTVTTTVMMPMGISDTASKLFSLYPNPANGTVNLLLNGSNGTAIITDVLGKTVATAILQQQTVMDIAALKSGIYFVKVICVGKELVQKLVVK